MALVAAAALAGCGGGHAHRAAPLPPQPKLPAELADRLAARSDDVAHELDTGDDCAALAAAQDLQHQTIAAVNAKQVPPALQETLLGAANALVVRISCTPPPPAEQDHEEQMKGEHGHGKAKGHHKHHHGEGD